MSTRFFAFVLVVFGAASSPACLEAMPGSQGDITQGDTAAGGSDLTQGDTGGARDAVQGDVGSSDVGPDDTSPDPTGKLEPCLAVHPGALHFMSVPVGQSTALPLELVACGPVPVTINSFTIAPDPIPGISLPPLNLPLTLGTGATLPLQIDYAPMSDSPALTGTLRLYSNAPDSPLEIPFTTAATSPSTGDCPIPRFSIAEGTEVSPPISLHLDASSSHAASDAEISGYQWSVEQPSGSASVFLPSAFDAAPTFEVSVVGTYRFYLDVWDSKGRKSRHAFERQVTVTSISPIHIELVWRTPGDPDETDQGTDARGWSVGSDLDLHFAKEYALGTCVASPEMAPPGRYDEEDCTPWFATDDDVYWANSAPIWDLANQSGPRLSRDDADGAGPELFDYEAPTPGSYKIGVHYWDDWHYGPSWASVRIFIADTLVASFGEVELHKSDLWEVGFINVPEMLFTPIQDHGEPVIINNFVP